MSFSSDVKQELNKNSNLSNKQLVKFELAGYLISENTSIIKNRMFKFSTENDYNINRFSKLLRNVNINDLQNKDQIDELINDNTNPIAPATTITNKETNIYLVQIR